MPALASLASAVAALMRELGLQATLAELRYEAVDLQPLAAAAHRSHFNFTAPFHPSAIDYAAMITGSLVAS